MCLHLARAAKCSEVLGPRHLNCIDWAKSLNLMLNLFTQYAVFLFLVSMTMGHGLCEISIIQNGNVLVTDWWMVAIA